MVFVKSRNSWLF